MRKPSKANPPKRANQRRRLLLPIWLLLVVSPGVRAAVSVSHIFSDNMVLQREMPIPVWGQADPGEKVVVKLNAIQAEVEAGAGGDWKVALPPAKAGGPFVLTITGRNTLSFSNVMVGEVWFCSGQSNMEMPLNNLNERDKYLKEATFPNIRLFRITRKSAGMPLPDVEANWVVCVPDEARKFSAAGYFFGRELHQQLNVPIGMICAAVGGSQIQPFTPYEGLALYPEFADAIKQIDRANQAYIQAYGAALDKFEDFLPKARRALADKRRLPPLPELRHEIAEQWAFSAGYNGMIAPIVPYAIRGAIWYQGESNRNDGALYTKRMGALIKGWRAVWGEGDFPVYFVQIAPNHYDEKALLLPEFWEAQAAVLALQNTGMAVINDIGNLKDIHPQNKLEVGRRLSLWALAKTYGRDVVYSGPLYKSCKIEGNKAVITFDYTGTGLASRDGQALTCFMIAGADRKFVPATATIDGGTVVVTSDAVREPVAVRFAWDQDSVPNLMNREGLPASAFRTDGSAAH